MIDTQTKNISESQPKTLSNPIDIGLHEKAVAAVASYKKSEIELIEALQKVDQARLFYQMGFPSLFVYCTSGLGLSEEVAYIYIRVARKALEVPALTEGIRNGTEDRTINMGFQA